jgi:hypothetical protein
MVMPASVPVTMAQLRTEFGGTAGVTKLSAYNRGGSLVPDTPRNAGVPTSVPIRLNQFVGASKLQCTISPSTLYATRATVGTVTSASCTRTISGATGATTTLWSRVSGDAAIAITSSTSSSTTFSASVGPANPSRVATFKCTVTDTVTNVDSNTNVTVTLEYNP